MTEGFVPSSVAVAGVGAGSMCRTIALKTTSKTTGVTETIARSGAISEGGETIEKLQQLQQEKGELKRTHAAQQDNVATPWEKKIQ